MEKPIFEYEDYKRFLADRLATSGTTRGARRKLADHLGCQSAFISQVLGGNTHFSHEHAIRISGFLGHTAEETHYFMALVSYGRAGTTELRRYYKEELARLREKRQSITARLKAKPALSPVNEMTYYSSWYYAAIHVMLSVPRFQSKTAIAEHLGLPLPVVSDCLSFLESVGLAAVKEGKYRIGNARIHLGKDSPMRSRHHANWRLKAMQAVERRHPEDLFYSAVYSLSEPDARKVRELLVDLVDKTEPLLRDSREEAVFGLALDFFRV